MVYVDPIQPCIPNPMWKWNKSCHMYADTTEELHATAKVIGLKRAWFQDKPSLCHYDLTVGKRAKALKAGAVSVGFRHVADTINARRNATSAKHGSPSG